MTSTPSAPQPVPNPPSYADVQTPPLLSSQDSGSTTTRSSFRNVTARGRATQLNFGPHSDLSSVSYDGVEAVDDAVQIINHPPVSETLLAQLLLPRMQKLGQPPSQS
ncbi:hypothetical protein DL771_002858 [Monosporascus sp. 5C6A]|nr:hypothetical protein DL771_002858 [Monosporascus sp. 5C6A]